MMLHFSDQNDVPRCEICAPPSGCHQVDALRCTPREYDRLRRLCPKEMGDSSARALVEPRGPRAQLVDAAVNVCVIFSIVPADLVDDAGGMLRRGGIVQIN